MEIDLERQSTEPLCRAVTHCRMCKTEGLVEYLNLGSTPPADQFRTKEELSYPEVSYPLRVLLCTSCGLSQLSHVVDPRVLYQHDYPYESSTTATGKKHWEAFSKAVYARISPKSDALVLDVGSNDGTLLSCFRELGVRVAGVDPAPNIAAIANGKGIPTLCAFYGPAAAKEILTLHGKADVIVGTNVFAHIDDLDSVFEACKILFDEHGVFIFESPHFGNLIKNLEYDTIYHEHLSYLSLTPVEKFVKKFGMEVFAVEEAEIHGGSFRVYIGMKGQRPIDKSVAEMLAREKEEKLHDINAMKEFAKRVEGNRRELMEVIEKALHEGKRIAAVSAPAKGMTLLNYCGITNRHLVIATEKSRLKIGRYTPGGHIPIVSDENLLIEKIDLALLLAWNFAPEIMRNNQEFTKKGGKFIIPIPKPKIV